MSANRLEELAQHISAFHKAQEKLEQTGDPSDLEVLLQTNWEEWRDNDFTYDIDEDDIDEAVGIYAVYGTEEDDKYHEYLQVRANEEKRGFSREIASGPLNTNSTNLVDNALRQLGVGFRERTPRLTKNTGLLGSKVTNGRVAKPNRWHKN